MVAILFDFDGVLADTLEVNLEVCRLFKPDLTVEEFMQKHKDNGEDVLDIDLSEEVMERFIEEQKKRLGGEHLLPVDDVLRELEMEHDLFIVSNSSEGNIRKVLSHRNLSPLFKDIFGMKTSLSKKDKIQSLLDDYGLEPNDCVLITDTVGDIKEGREVGVKTAGVAWGFHDKETLKEEDPEIIFEEPEDIHRSIGEL